MADIIPFDQVEHDISGDAPATPGVIPYAQVEHDVSGSDWNITDSARQFLSGAAEGGVGLLGLAADLNPVQPTGPNLDFRYSKFLNSGLEKVLPEKEPEYRFARTIGQFSTPLPGESLLMQGLKAVLGGTGAQVAEDVTGDSKIAPLVGAIATGSIPSVAKDIYSMARSLFKGATQAEIKGSAALAQKELTGLTPLQIETAIRKTPADDLGKLMTTAEVTDNAGMAQIEKTLSAADEPARLYNERANLRNDARDRLLDLMSKTGSINKEALGTKLMSRASDVAETMGNEAEALWRAVPRDVPVNIEGEQTAISALVGEKQAGLPLKSPVRTLVDQFTSEEANQLRDGFPIRTSGELQDIRSDALSLMRDANITPTETRVLTGLQKAIDSAMERGLTGENYDLWSEARKATADQAQTFARGTAGGALTSEFARPSNVLSNAIKGDTQSITELKSAIRSDPQIIEDVKRGLLDSIPRDSSGNLTANSTKKFLSANEGALKELFGQEHYTDMQRILEDLQSEAKVSQSAFKSSKGGSVTSQRNTVAGAIQDTMLGALLPGSGVLAQIAEGVKKTAGIRDAKAVQELLFRAALDPSFALELSRAPTEVRMLNAFDRLKQMGTNLADSSARTGVRALARNDGPGPGAQSAPSLTPSQIGMKPSEKERIPVGIGPKGSPSTSQAVSPPSPNPTSNPKVSEYDFMNKMFKKVGLPKQVLEDIRKDPVDYATMMMESGGDPNAKNPESSAGGIFQLVKKTAGNLGVKNVFDAEDNYEGYKKLKAENIRRFGNDPATLYAAHYLGAPTLQKVLSGKSLTERERSQVDNLVNVLLPKYIKIYQSVIA